MSDAFFDDDDRCHGVGYDYAYYQAVLCDANQMAGHWHAMKAFEQRVRATIATSAWEATGHD